MALTKKPAFEQEPTAQAQGDTAVAEAPATTTTAAARTPDAAAETTTAIAKASATSLSTSDAANAAKAFKRDVEAMKGAADFSYGTHRVFKAKDGVIKEMSGDKLVLGKWVKVHLLAWDRHFEISPGEDGASSGGYVAYSIDGVTVDTVVGEEMKSWVGKGVAEYLNHLRTVEEFADATKREFIDCQCAAMGSEEESDFSGVIQVTLSSSSIPAFKRYQSDLEATAKCVQMGLPGYALPASPFQFYMVREAAEKGKNSWTKIKICSTLPAKV